MKFIKLESDNNKLYINVEQISTISLHSNPEYDKCRFQIIININDDRLFFNYHEYQKKLYIENKEKLIKALEIEE